MIVKQEGQKTRRYFKYDEEAICDSLVDLGEKYYTTLYNSSIELYNNKEIIEAIILMCEEEDNTIFQMDKKAYYDELDFSEYKNEKYQEYIEGDIKILKLNSESILQILIKELADDKYNGPYLANANYFGELGKDFRVVLIIGDYRDTEIEHLNLNDIDSKLEFST